MSEDRTAAATKLLVELLLEGLAQQVEGKRVDAGVGEGQDTSYNTAHKVNQGGVHLVGEKYDSDGYRLPSTYLQHGPSTHHTENT